MSRQYNARGVKLCRKKNRKNLSSKLWIYYQILTNDSLCDKIFNVKLNLEQFDKIFSFHYRLTLKS